jgi:hypothetical protein
MSPIPATDSELHDKNKMVFHISTLSSKPYVMVCDMNRDRQDGVDVSGGGTWPRNYSINVR